MLLKDFGEQVDASISVSLFINRCPRNDVGSISHPAFEIRERKDIGKLREK